MQAILTRRVSTRLTDHRLLIAVVCGSLCLSSLLRCFAELMYIYLRMRHVLLLLTCLYLLMMSASAFAQTVDQTRTPQKTSKVLYADILEKLKSGGGNEHAVSKANKELIRSIKAHGLYLAITDQEWKNLTESGATKKLLHAIDKASRVREKQIKEMNRLYQIVLDNYKFSDRQKLTAAINAAKEFIARFGTEEIAEQNVGWLKHVLPRFEQRLQKLDSIR